MPEGQDAIYYATGESISRIELLPQTEQVKDKGYEILYFTENVDEFAIRMMQNYQTSRSSRCWTAVWIWRAKRRRKRWRRSRRQRKPAAAENKETAATGAEEQKK